MGLEKKQKLGVVSIALVLFGLLAVPLIIQRFTGYSTVQAAFGVIIVYFFLHLLLKRYDIFEKVD